tara:strand:- start:246 stop:1142 length:897 start_codon:yes stop_codon:yes gene_type:complete
MYGSFILFQYIDEHLGGRETIRNCWEASRELANPNTDVTYDAIDAALEPFGLSFEDAYLRMRIANRVLSNQIGAEPYTYQEAKAYREVVGDWGMPSGPPEATLLFQKGNIETINNSGLSLYESAYYLINTDDPVSLTGIESEGRTQLTSVLKLRDSDEWTVRSGNQINIDPEINLDWISLIVSPLGRNNNNWDWTIRISDGFSEDFTLFSPYPNPSIGELVSIDMQVISSQTITTRIFDLSGREIWSKIEEFNSPSLKTVQWNGINHNGNKVSNGIYFIVAEGINQTDSKKIIYLKKN